tara:strand:+ start:844 stop:1965 length:1122 start_codon:yes stop_codon:yes gene_type:complete
MDIKCHNCGTTINLNESLKSSIIEDQKKAIKAEMNANHQREIDEIKAERSLIKDAELKAKKEQMRLEDALKEAEIKSEEKFRQLIESKEEELQDQNEVYKETIRAQLEAQSSEKEKINQMESQAKIKEKDLEIKRLIKEAEDARSRLDHVKNSQELVGEAAEVLLLERLQNNFTFDQFQEIKKGQQGADIFQTVCNRSDEIIGSILYECKKTKRWSEGWIAKFKDDIRKQGASIGILVSETLPEYCNDVVFKDGIWITSPRFVLFVAAACSKEIHSVNKAKTVKAGKSSLEGAVYDYITGDEFVDRFKAMAETFIAQLDDLEREERALKKSWRIRRKQIDKSQTNLVEIFGDLEALSDGNIKALEDFQLNLEE